MTITGQSKLKIVYDMLGVDRLTPEARELLKPENCPCFEKSKKFVPAIIPMTERKTPEDKKATLLELYAQGMNDKQIGYHMGFDSRTIGIWRKSLGLESNFFLNKQSEKGDK